MRDINSPEDLKGLTIDALSEIAEDIRKEIIQVVSETGGHLASNLGAVELTVALHHVFESPKDKIVWDVGHQAYTHKILTGRKERFHTLRKRKGISGFPKRSESPHDSFGTGHSSTSISAALGMACARDLKGEDYKVIAVIGDGALTAGLAFEGMNHAGHLKKDLIVILNDNEMSISKNVGALSAHLNKILTGELYRKFKKDTGAIIQNIPRFGGTLSQLAKKIEEFGKGLILPGVLFEELGFNYIGPIDGHNLVQLVETFKKIKEVKGPMLIHVVTQKGRGYEYSEKYPSEFHGTGPFVLETGEQKPGGLSFSKAFGDAALALGEKDKRVVAISAAMTDATGLALFAKKFPDRFFDVGIAEPHAVTLAAGIAAQGLRPIVAIYSTFLQRGYDEIIHDVCLQRLPVIFCLDRAGLVGEDGPTHHGVFDIAYLRHIPNLVLMAPKNAGELSGMLAFALTLEGPSAIRFPRGKAETGGESPEISLGRAEILSQGADLAMLAYGSMAIPAIEASARLKARGINCLAVNMRFAKPLDKEIIARAANIGKVLTIEEGSLSGGFGSAVLEELSSEGYNNVKVKRLGIPDDFIEHAGHFELLRSLGLDADGIESAALALLS